MSAVKRGVFSETLVAHHPGVTTMWLAGPRTFFIPPRVDVPNLARARWFIGVGVWIGIGIACFLIYRLFGRWVGFASFASLAYSPLFLAQTLRVHTDALATVFILTHGAVLVVLLCKGTAPSLSHRRRHLTSSPQHGKITIKQRRNATT